MLAATSVGEVVSLEEMDYAYGCDSHVSSTNFSIYTHCYIYVQTYLLYEIQIILTSITFFVTFLLVNAIWSWGHHFCVHSKNKN